MLIALLAVPGVDLIVMVLVWTKAPLLFRTELVPPDGLEEQRPAGTDEVKRLGDHPVVIRVRMGKASAEVAANGDHAELLLVRAGQALLHVLRDRRRARPTSCAQGVDVAECHFGRILDTLERIGELDNTIIMIISDNGASAEGGATGSFNEMLFFNMVPESFEDNLAKIDELGGTKAYNHYPWGWTWARHSSSPAPSTR